MFDKRSDCSKCGHSVVCPHQLHYRDFSYEIQKATKYGELVEDKDIFFVVTECCQWIPITPNINAKMDILRGIK